MFVKPFVSVQKHGTKTVFWAIVPLEKRETAKLPVAIISIRWCSLLSAEMAGEVSWRADR